MKQTKKKAFTLLELIIVIVIMGIVGKYGMELLMQAYESYIGSSVQARFQAQSEATVQQIANRLQYRIPISLIARQANVSGGTKITAFSTLEDAIDTDTQTTVLEWIGYDVDGWNGDGSSTNPTWSGVIDLAANTDSLGLYTTNASPNLLISPGTDTSRSDAVIDALSNGKFNTNDSALFFVGVGSVNPTDDFGWNGVLTHQNHAMHRINKGTLTNEFAPTVGNFATGQSSQLLGEYYRLAWTAYALEFDRNTHQLSLYYNYRPWAGENYADNGTKVRLMDNVDTFKFASLGDLLKVQVCVTDSTLFTGNYAAKGYSICKEKTVF